MSKISELYSKMQIETLGLDREQHHKQRRENAYSLSYVRRKIGERERKTLDKAPRAHKPNGRKWKRIADQLGGNSLELIHWGKFLSIWEFSVDKNDGHKGQILTKLRTGNLKRQTKATPILLTRML